MEQVLHYRDIRYVVGHEQDQRREWVIFPADGPEQGAVRGQASADGTRGSFKSAVFAAQRAIDIWIEERSSAAAG